jgi:HNH endonuclease
MNEEEKKICTELVRLKKLKPEQAIAAVRADFRCEYCDLWFLDPKHPENNYQWEGFDHLVPRCANVRGTDDPDNIVCACQTCNKRVKLRWNPLDDPRFAGRRDRPSRAELITAVRDYIKMRRVLNEKAVRSWRKIAYPHIAAADAGSTNNGASQAHVIN